MLLNDNAVQLSKSYAKKNILLLTTKRASPRYVAPRLTLKAAQGATAAIVTMALRRNVLSPAIASMAA